jgi:BirA family biotin operon repressor/biotin-[acetyl-CoA-carboxylase] ligase
MLHSSIVGIGLNINQSDFPDQLINPISMKLLLKDSIDINQVLETLIVQLEKHYFQFKRNELNVINENYQSLLYRKDEKAYFKIKNKRVEAVIREVNKQGEIVLEIDNELKSFSNSEIKMIME